MLPMAATFLSKAAQAVIQTFIRRGEDFWLKLGPNGVALLSRHLAARVLANGVAEDAWPELLAIEGWELASVEKTHRIFSGKAGLLLKAQENGLQIAGVPVAARAVVKATDASSVPYNEITILPDKGTRAFGVGFWELHDALTAIARAARAVRRDALFALFVEEPGKPVWVVAELGGRRLEFSLGSGLVDIDRPRERPRGSGPLSCCAFCAEEADSMKSEIRMRLRMTYPRDKGTGRSRCPLWR